MATLVELHVEDLAVIRSARMVFGPGLNAITGETGAGKSLLVDALSVALGGRVPRDLIRAGAERALVEAVFRLSPADIAVRTLLGRHGLDLRDDDLIVLTRELHRGGRSVGRVNGRIVPASVARAVGDLLADVHGQGAQVSLADPQRQLVLVDAAAGAQEQRFAARSAIARVQRLREALAELDSAAAAGAARRDLLAFQTAEIEALDPQSGEEQALADERDLLAHAGAIREATSMAYELLYGGDGSAVDQTALASRLLTRTPDPTGALATHVAALEAAEATLADAARELRAHGEGIGIEAGRQEEVEARLEAIRRLTHKYDGTVDEILAFAASARTELEGLDGAGGRRERLAQELGAATAEAGAVAWALSQARVSAGERLSEAVGAELADLALADAGFSVVVRRAEAPDGLPGGDGRCYAMMGDGMDEVEFLVAVNQGEEPKPLARAASGGETSRLMLAIAGAMAMREGAPVMVFDEIDAGVGGRTGDVVGRKLWSLARGAQVLCVTHLPQIAAYADHHIRVEKGVAGGRTFAHAETLGHADRVRELGAMLGGMGSPQMDAAARLLMEQATGYKLADTALATAAVAPARH